MALTPAPGRDPSQRQQILDSRNLLPTEFMAPNNLTWGSEPTFSSNAPVGLYPGKQYILYDNRTGKQLASGSTAEEIQNILNIIDKELIPQGNKADWRLLDMGGAPTGATIDMHTRLPAPFGEAVKIGDQYGLPIAGDTPNNLFKDLILPLLAVPAATAAAYFGGNALLGATGGGAAAPAGALIPEGTSLAAQGLASLPANLAAINASTQAALAGAGLGAAGTGAATGGLLASTPAAAAPAPVAAAAPAAAIGELAPITVTATGSGFTLPTVAALTAGTGAGLLAGATTPPPTPTTQQGPIDSPDVNKNLLQKITAGMNLTDYLTLAGLAGSAAGGLFGGGGGGGVAATSPYTSLLGPAPTLGGSPAAARQMNAPYAGDYETYGMGPEYQFFKPA